MSNSADNFFESLKTPSGPPPGFSCQPNRYTLPGALGAAMVGISTGYFKLDRGIAPISPFPAAASPEVHERARLFARYSSVAWRFSKRMFVGSILFPFLICQFQRDRKSASIGNCTLAGAISGAIFGLRGGPVGVVNGTVTFGVLGGLTEVARRVGRDA